MPSNTIDFFKYVIIIQIFFGIGASMITYAIPDKNYIQIVMPADVDSPEQITDDITQDITSIRNPPGTINTPFIDTAFVLFCSGNIIVDAFLNSIFAIPSMATILVNVLGIFFPIDAQLLSLLGLFIYTLLAVLYIIGIICVLMNLRSQGGLTNVV